MNENEVEFDSDDDEQNNQTKTLNQPPQKSKSYTSTTRIAASNPKKQKKSLNNEGSSSPSKVEEYDSEEDAYMNMMKEDCDEEDDFQRQLRLEKEESGRVKDNAQSGENEKKKTKMDEDGTEYEWDPNVKGWFPKVPDKQFFEYQQKNYIATAITPVATTPTFDTKLLENKFYRFNEQFYVWDFEQNNWKSPETNAIYAYVDYMTGISYEWNQNQNEWLQSKTQQLGSQKKSDQKGVPKTDQNDKSVIQPKKKEGWVDVNEDKNTNVYVSGLPLDISDEEFEEMLSKYGIIMKDVLTHKLKCKLYRTEENEVKGDGRCCYLMPESVKLCLQLLDGSDYKGHKVKVEKAKFELKGKYDPTKAGVLTEAQKKKLSKKKEREALDKQRKRLLDWDERPAVKREKYEKVVVIKGLFKVEEIKKDYDVVKRLKDDLRTSLEQYGVVKKIMIQENHPEGVATVSFKEIDMADNCCEYLDNRVWRNGRVISCQLWDGQTKYDVEETEEEAQKRIDEWHQFLEASDD